MGVQGVDLQVFDSAEPNTYILHDAAAKYTSPAWAIFKSVCMGPNGQGECGYSSARAVLHVIEARPRLTLRSGRIPDPSLTSTKLGSDLHCLPPEPNETTFFGRLGKSVSLFFDQFFLHTNKDVHRSDFADCISIAHLNLRQIDAPAFADDAAKLIRGRVVMVGMHQDLSNDRYVSPIFGAIPGVFSHAIALNELFTDGAHALEPAWALPGNLDAGDLATAVFIALATLLAGWLHDKLSRIHKARKGEASWGHFGAALFYGVVCPLGLGIASIFVIWVCFHILRWSPSTWLGAGGSIIVAATIVMGPAELQALARTIPRKPAFIAWLFAPLRVVCDWAGETFTEMTEDEAAELAKEYHSELAAIGDRE